VEHIAQQKGKEKMDSETAQRGEAGEEALTARGGKLQKPYGHKYIGVI